MQTNNIKGLTDVLTSDNSSTIDLRPRGKKPSLQRWNHCRISFSLLTSAVLEIQVKYFYCCICTRSSSVFSAIYYHQIPRIYLKMLVLLWIDNARL